MLAGGLSAGRALGGRGDAGGGRSRSDRTTDAAAVRQPHGDTARRPHRRVPLALTAALAFSLLGTAGDRRTRTGRATDDGAVRRPRNDKPRRPRRRRALARPCTGRATGDPAARGPRNDKPRRPRRRVLLTLTAALAFLLLGAAAAPAYATGYRYWSYWLSTASGWTYAQTGPATHVPHDGDLEGWRFAVSRDAADQAAKPRGSWSFAAICGHTPAAAGHKRVALVIDPGTAGDAPGSEHVPPPRTACASVSDDAGSADALAAVARPLRYDSAGILCAIGGYPAAGCGEQVAAGNGSGGDSGGTRPHHGPEVGWFAAAGAIAVIGWAARWQSRRRRP